jgi:hypothetical protein
MQISAEFFNGADKFVGNTDSCWFGQQFNVIRDAAEGTDLSRVSPEDKTTEFIRKSLDFPLRSWHTKVIYTPDLPPIKANANYTIDYQLRNMQVSSRNELVSIELAFDNRQTIGTNLLKLESASRKFRDDTGGVCISFLMAPADSLKTKGYWNGAVASASEYSWAIRKAYAFCLQSPLVLLTVS